MKIYTYQSPFVWHELQKNGIYTPENLVDKCQFLKDCENDSFGFLYAYKWLREQMINRGVSSIGEAKELIWGWSDKFSLNAHSLLYKENRKTYNEHVLIELEIPEDRLCASLFNEWHSPLNNAPILSQECLESYYDLLNSCKKLREKSWENIFDLNFEKKYLDDENHLIIQYTFFQILLPEVLSVKLIQNCKSKLIYKKK